MVGKFTWHFPLQTPVALPPELFGSQVAVEGNLGKVLPVAGKYLEAVSFCRNVCLKLYLVCCWILVNPQWPVICYTIKSRSFVIEVLETSVFIIFTSFPFLFHFIAPLCFPSLSFSPPSRSSTRLGPRHSSRPRLDWYQFWPRGAVGRWFCLNGKNLHMMPTFVHCIFFMYLFSACT